MRLLRCLLLSSLPSLLPATPARRLAELGAHVDNKYVRDLESDPETERHEPNRVARSVRSGHFVLVRPTPLPSPVLVATSYDMCEQLNLNKEACGSSSFLRLFSGGDVSDDIPGFGISWATPYALSIYGEEIVPDGAGERGDGYGDGRAISIGEVLVDSADASGGRARWELQLKGAGKTPFCRGADGRAVLRSSVREFIASEAMAALGVPTTRALSLVVSTTETVQRPWYANASTQIAIGAHRPVRNGGDLLRAEPVAITTRAARSFLRVGQLELYGRRARRGDTTGHRQLEKLVRHAIRREYPEVLASHPAANLRVHVIEMARLASTRFAFLAAEWLRVGYTQSNYNADNSLIGGATVDYGPFGFIERYDPGWGMWIHAGKHYSFTNQPLAAARNFRMFCRALEPLLDGEGIRELRAIVASHDAVSSQALARMWARKLGLPPDADHSEWTAEAWTALDALLRQHPTDYTIFWRQLSEVPAAAFDGGRTAGELLRLLEPAHYSSLPEHLHPAWTTWLQRWLDQLQGSVGAAGHLDAIAIGDAMRAASPKYVPREWMLVDAYKAAERGDYGPVRELLATLQRPYDEQDGATAERFYRRAPPGAEQQGGVGFMS